MTTGQSNLAIGHHDHDDDSSPSISGLLEYSVVWLYNDVDVPGDGGREHGGQTENCQR